MLSLTIKDIRDALEETLRKHYGLIDYSISPTIIIEQTNDLRIGFYIMNSEFWIDFAPATEHLTIVTFSLGDPNHVDMAHIWLQPYRYDKKDFKFGWRKDLECFFDAFEACLKNRVEKTHNPSIKITLEEDQLMNYLEEEEAASYEEYVADPPKTKFGQVLACEANEKSVLSQILDAMNEETPVAKVDESKVGECKIADKPSIFNSLKDDEDEAVEW